MVLSRKTDQISSEMFDRAQNSIVVSHYEQQGITHYKQILEHSILTRSFAPSSLRPQARSTPEVKGQLVVFLTRRLVIRFVLEFVKSANLDGLQGLFLVAGVHSGLLARLSCILILVLFLLFVFLFGRT